MQLRHQFIQEAGKRLSHLPPEARKRTLQIICDDLKDIIDPWRELREEPIAPPAISIDDLIALEQIARGIEPDPEPEPEESPQFDWGREALHEAIWNDDIPAVQKLAEDGADLEVKDNAGRTPYQLALMLNNPKVIAILKRAIKSP
ncbi:hypothetical protein CMI47_11225 [Candidatus Pacearchaeota archaeon]|nr:hypothetical protein [Candidatus Pacearchaeota archaeon]